MCAGVELSVSDPVPSPSSEPLQPISFVLNHRSVVLQARPGARLLDVLRQAGHLTGTKEGCGEGECGACTVLLDGQAVCSCLVLAQSVEGQSVETVEGLVADDGSRPHPVQAALVQHMGTQCGFCTPGMVMSAVSLLEKCPNPSEHDIQEALAGNLCRCTGYTRVVHAIQDAAAQMRAHADEITEVLPSQSTDSEGSR